MITQQQKNKFLQFCPALEGFLPHLEESFKYAKLNTPKRMKMFLAQCAHESGEFRLVSENLNYSSTGLLSTFPKYFTKEEALKYARKPIMIANKVYANRMGNSNEASGDGWKNRGRGVIQITGKTNYDQLMADIKEIKTQDDLLSPRFALLSAAWFWNERRLNSLADVDDFKSITKKINGGLNGYDDRKHQLERAAALELPVW